MGRATDGTVSNGLLAMLLTKGLVRQPEVTVTTSIAWLCQRAGGAAALQQAIADSAGGLQPGTNAAWMAEVRAPDGTRTDLECHWGDPCRPHVVVEAKIGAPLHVQQLVDYLKDQSRRLADDPGAALLVVLVPADRRPEAEEVLAKAVAQSGRLAALEGRLHTDVWDYDHLLDALARGLGDDPDLGQLRLFIEACEALDIKPFTKTELLSPSGSRRADLIAVLDRATSRLNPPGQRLMPSGADEHHEWRRYLVVAPEWTNVAVGLLREDRHPPTAIDPTRVWLRVHRDTPDAQLAGRRLRHRFGQEVVRDDSGHTWLPLRVPPGVGGAAMVDELAAQVEAAVQAIGQPEAAASER